MIELKQGLELKQWILGEKIGAGACSDVYAVTPSQPLVTTRAGAASSKTKGKKNAAKDQSECAYVMKLSPLPQNVSKNKKRKKTPAERNADALYAEHLLYQTYLRDHPGLPSLPPGAYGEDKGYRFLVLERLGRSLADVHQKYKKIPSSTAARLGADLLDTIRYIHSKNVVYVDVKPENFMLDRHTESQVYCVDFGIAERYIAATGKHKEFKLGAVVGTPTFLSVHCHEGGTAGRRDDVEALFYVLVHLMRGSLPWENARNDQQGAKIKRDTSLADLCDGLPSEWKKMLEHIRKCGYEEKPDYNYYFDQLASLGGKMRLNTPFNWGHVSYSGRVPQKESKVDQSSESEDPKPQATTKDVINEVKSAATGQKRACRSKDGTIPESKRARVNRAERAPSRNEKAAMQAVVAAAAATAAEKIATKVTEQANRGRYNLRFRKAPK